MRPIGAVLPSGVPPVTDEFIVRILRGPTSCSAWDADSSWLQRLLLMVSGDGRALNAQVRPTARNLRGERRSAPTQRMSPMLRSRRRGKARTPRRTRARESLERRCSPSRRRRRPPRGHRPRETSACHNRATSTADPSRLGLTRVPWNWPLTCGFVLSRGDSEPRFPASQAGDGGSIPLTRSVRADPMGEKPCALHGFSPIVRAGSETGAN